MTDRDELVRRLVDMLSEAQSGYIPCCAEDEQWNVRRDELVAEAIAALQPAGEQEAAQPIGEVVIGPKGDVEGWTVVRWIDTTPPVGTKLYTTPPDTRRLALEEAAKAIPQDIPEMSVTHPDYDSHHDAYRSGWNSCAKAMRRALAAQPEMGG